jgi:hypothetical protein
MDWQAMGESTERSQSYLSDDGLGAVRGLTLAVTVCPRAKTQRFFRPVSVG